MIALQSELTGLEIPFSDAKQQLEKIGFTLGGNWDYEHGCFDGVLDNVNKVWLRLPFRVTDGMLDAEREAQDTTVRFDHPYVLKHVYNEGLDPEASPMTYGALFDQFQDPVDADAPVEQNWIDKGKERLKQAEKALVQ